MSDSDRILRAGNFVFGLMDEVERKRAERDLESDAAFRAAVKALTARMAEADSAIAGARRPRWDMVSARLAELPQMQGRLATRPQAAADRPQASGATLVLTRSRMLVLAAAAAVALMSAFGAGYGVGAWSVTAATPVAPASQQAP